MTPEQQAKYVAAGDAAESALAALGRARAEADQALQEALEAGGGDEARGQGNVYGMVFFDNAIKQSAGAKGLMPIFAGSPDRHAQVGVRVGGDVAEIIKGRLGMTETPVLTKGVDRVAQTSVSDGAAPVPVQ